MHLLRTSRAILPFLLLPLGLAALGCGDTDAKPPAPPAPFNVPTGCNPIAFEHDCLLPYPSDFFLVDDPSTKTGKRVELTDAAKPTNKNEQPYDFTATHPVDGFSHHQPIMLYFKNGVSTDGVVFHTDPPENSLKPDSKVILLDAETGKPVPVWGEVDMNTSTPSERAFIIRPFVRLDNSKRYIVAVQGLLDAKEDGSGGAVAQTPEGFKRIRDKQAGGDPTLAPLSDRYEKEIFPALAAHGVDRAKLQLAWDFTTSSEESNTKDMLDIHADVIPKLTANPPKVTVTKVTENTPDVEENIWLRIEGTIRVPLYLDSDQPGANLHRDAMGKVTQNGEAEVPFIVQVPQSMKPADGSFTPARIMEYGHGFFGLAEEINYGFMRGYSNEGKYITAAVDWWGMSENDLPVVIQHLFDDPGTAFDFVDRLHQAMVNFIALSYALKGPMTEVAELKRFDKLLYDPDQLIYYGISQGAIFGVPMLALNPLLDRAALSVGGGPYSLMMSRSASYGQIYSILSGQLEQPLNIMKFTMLSQSTWDRVDPMTYAPHLLKDTYPDSPANRHLLFQIGIGDHSVNNLASHLVARSMGIPLIDPSPTPIWGLDSATTPADDGLVVVDFKLATVPGIYCKVPPELADGETNVHEGVRRNTKIKAQLDQFFQPNGMIQQTCDGPCDPE